MKLHFHVTVMLTRQIAGAAIGLFTSVALARTLSVNDNGLYASLALIPLMAATLFSLGIGSASVFHTGSKNFQPDEVLLSNLILSAISALLAVLVFWTLIIFNLLPGDLLTSPMNVVLALLTILPMLVFSNVTSVLQGLQRFEAYGLFTILPSAFLLLSILFMQAFSWPSLSVTSTLFAYFIGYVIATLAILVNFRKTITFRIVSLDRYRNCIEAIIRYGFKSHIGNVFGFLNYRLNYYFVIGLNNSEGLGLFSIAIAVGEALLILSSAMAAVIFPWAASNPNQTTESLKVSLSAARWTLYATTLAGTILVIFAQPLVSFVFGSKYQSINILIYILLPGILCLSFARVLANEIAGRGMPTINTKIAAWALIVSIFLNFTLIPTMALAGAALASSISYCVLSAMTVRAYARLHELSIKSVICPRRADLELAWRALRKIQTFFR